MKFRPKPQRPEMPRHEWVNPSTKVGCADIATALIGTHVGVHTTRVNAPTSAALH
ncbi:hypothetical protein U8Q06_27305 (plasmid) [Rhizobium beringeri]|uniref:hypothetical protein n=1 Tax=Rhizobium beringeri TaxID=3019934 RepID=UPI002E0F642C|nr:hypothetical protein U8Q06_27305 [Rhizobium beringeri]